MYNDFENPKTWLGDVTAWYDLHMALVTICYDRGWTIDALAKRFKGREAHKYVVKLPSHPHPGSGQPISFAYPLSETEARFLTQGVMNLCYEDDVTLLAHEVTDGGRWVMDVWHVQTQWHFEDGTRPDELPASKRQTVEGKEYPGYLVVFTSEGVRCSCDYGAHHDDTPNGSSPLCTHIAVARMARHLWYRTQKQEEPYVEAEPMAVSTE